MSFTRKIFMSLIILSLALGALGATAQPAQAASCSYYHTVRAGESLSWIARYYGAYWPYLAQINGIPGPRYRIYAGQVLCIGFGGKGYQQPYNPPYYQPYNPPYYDYPVQTNSGRLWTFSIVDVDPDTSVTIHTQNLPSNVLFNAKMGRRSGNGYEWFDLPDFDSDRGKRIEVVFTIPEELKDVNQLVVRVIQKKKNGNTFHYDQWFSNTPGGAGTGSHAVSYNPYKYGTYGTIPTIWIVGVSRNNSVTIQTANFPANLDFQVLMGPMGTQGHGYYVTTFNSGDGGVMNLTFSIPPELYGSAKVSIRTQNQWSGYFSYNWFYNNSTY